MVKDMKTFYVLGITFFLVCCYVAPVTARTDMQPKCRQASDITQYIADERLAGVEKADMLEHAPAGNLRKVIIKIYSMPEVALPYVGKIVYTNCMRKYNTI